MVISMNVCCQLNVLHCMQVPQYVLAWEQRSPQLIEEIAESKADLICLQEVNRYGEHVHRPLMFTMLMSKCLFC